MEAMNDSASRRDFFTSIGRIASTAVVANCIPTGVTVAQSNASQPSVIANEEWDLSWLELLRPATDRAVFDWPVIGDAGDPIVVEIAERYLDNCRTIYRGPYDARVVLNIRTTAIPAAMTDRLWETYSLGAEYNLKDPTTKQPATQNPFWRRAPSPAPGITMPTIEDLLNRGAIILVCDFALGHLSTRLAAKTGKSVNTVRDDLRSGLVRGSYLVPSGIFGLARAQNAGCAFVRM